MTAALALLVAASFKPCKRKIHDILDDKINALNSEIVEAVRTKELAQAQLEEVKKLHRESVAYNQKMHDDARENAESIIIEAHRKVSEMADHGKAMMELYQDKNDKDILSMLKNDVVITVLSKIEERFRNIQGGAEHGGTEDDDEERIELINRIWH